MTIVKSFRADVSSVTPLSERMANARNVSFGTFYGGLSTLSTQLIIINYQREIMSTLDESNASSAQVGSFQLGPKRSSNQKGVSKFFSQSQPRNHLDGVQFLTEYKEV